MGRPLSECTSSSSGGGRGRTPKVEWRPRRSGRIRECRSPSFERQSEDEVVCIQCLCPSVWASFAAQLTYHDVRRVTMYPITSCMIQRVVVWSDEKHDCCFCVLFDPMDKCWDCRIGLDVTVWCRM